MEPLHMNENRMETGKNGDVLHLRNLVDQFQQCLETQSVDRSIELLKVSLKLFADPADDLNQAVPERAELFDYVAAVLAIGGRLEAAHAFYHRSLAIRRNIFGEDHLLVGVSLDKLADCLEHLGKTTEASELADRARAIFKAHLNRLNEALSILQQQEQFADALPIATEAAELAFRVAGENARLYAQSLNNLAFIYKQLGKHGEAEQYYSKALDIWKAVENTLNDPDYAAGLYNFGALYLAQDEHSKAEPLFRQAVEILRASVGADEPIFLEILYFTARVLDSPGEDASEIRVLQAREMRRRVQLLIQCLNSLARTYEIQGKPSEAESLYLTAIQMCRPLFRINHPDTLATYGALLELYKTHENSEAFDRLMSELGPSFMHIARNAPFQVSFVPSVAQIFKPWLEAMSMSDPELSQTIGELTDDAFQKELQKCVDDFIQQNYSDCFRQAILLSVRKPSLEVLQLFLLSIQWLDGAYLGKQTDRLYLTVEDLLSTIEDQWARHITNLSLGQINVEEVLADAENDAQRCQASFYAACRFLIEGKVAEAERQFDLVFSLDTDTLERRIAPEISRITPPTAVRDMDSELAHLNSQVIEFMLTGQYYKAIPIATRAYDLGLTEGLDLSDRNFRVSLYNVAALMYRTGDYSKAELSYARLVEFYRTEDNSDVVSKSAALNGLGLVRLELAQYREAEGLFREAINVVKGAGRQHNQHTLQAIGNLAELYREQKDYARAVPLYEEVLSIQRAVGEQSAEYARWLNNYGLMHLEAGNLESAAELLKQALEIRLEVLPENHPDLASSLLSLANLESVRHNIAAVKQHVKEALEIYQEQFGSNHYTVAVALNNLANIYLHRGELGEAEHLLRQAHEMLVSSLGSSHPIVATVQANLALVCAAGGRYEEALGLMESSASIEEETIWQVFATSSDRRRTDYVQSSYLLYYAMLSLSLRFTTSERFIRAAYNLVLKRKGIATEASVIQRDELLTGQYPQLSQKILALRELRQKIATKTLKEPGVEGPTAHRQILEDWTAQKDQLEAEIARQIPEMSLERQLRTADRSAIAQKLPPDAALIEFVRFNAFNFTAVRAPSEAQWVPARYLAFVLRAGAPDDVALIDLGEAQPIDHLIAAFRQAISGEADYDASRGDLPSVIETTGVSTRSDRRNLRAALIASTRSMRPRAANAPRLNRVEIGAALRQTIFDPLLPALTGRTQLFLAPDGDLTRLPFEVLPLDEQRCVIDAYQISYLSVGRDVLRFGTISTRQPTAPLVVAAPNFDLGEHGLASFNSGIPFQQLADTRQEGVQVAKLLQVSALLDDGAVEQTLKIHSSPRILHIATHGFFLPDPQHNPNQDQIGVSIGDLPAMSALGRLSAVENPLLRAGLALAGVNTWLQGHEEALDPAAEDGILNGVDVSSLDLLDTELVVLSACETGLGSVQVGEGVFGLRRAFVLAGAKTLVMSLWKVPDRQTQELMELFYQHVLNGTPRAEALRAAQLAMKAKYPNPLYWGAFICQGEPGPLPASGSKSSSKDRPL